MYDNVHLRFDDSALFLTLMFRNRDFNFFNHLTPDTKSSKNQSNHPKIPRFRELFDLLKKACHIGHISCDTGVSQNGGTPKWMVYSGKPYLKCMIWGYHHLRKHPYKYTDGFFWVGYFSIHFRHFHQGAPKSRFDPPELQAPVLCERRPLHLPIGKELAAEKSIFFLKIYEKLDQRNLKGCYNFICIHNQLIHQVLV